MNNKKCSRLFSFNLLEEKGGEKDSILYCLLKKHGINFSTGVPCGVLKNIINNLLIDSEVFHVAVNRESEAIGVAAGAYFSGKKPLVYMQNSGLFNSSNDVASLLIPYRIPIFFVVSYRGCEGEDAIQHLVTGGSTEKLLDSFGLFYQVYDRQNLDFLINEMFFKMKETNLPVFLLLKRGWNL